MTVAMTTSTTLVTIIMYITYVGLTSAAYTTY